MKWQVNCLNQPLSIEVIAMGQDYLISIQGGSKPHIGSVTTMYKQDGEGRMSTQRLPGHMDHVISEAYAKAFYAAFQSTITVACGIHYDDITKSDLEMVQDTCQKQLREILEQLKAGG